MNFLVRILIAVVVVLVLWAVIPPFFRVVGFDVTADVMTIFRWCIAGIAVLYVLAAKWPKLLS